MSTIVVELYQALREAGVDERLAREAAHAVLGSDMKNELATKADLVELRALTKSDLAELRAFTKSELAEFRAEFRGDLATLRTELAATRVELIKWNVGAMAVLTAIFSVISRLG